MKTRSKSKSKTGSYKIPYDNSDDSQEYASTIISPEEEIQGNRKRFRKKEDQVGVLLKAFNENPYWSKSYLNELMKKTGLTESQIYKWN